MNADMGAIIKAKADAVASLADTLTQAIELNEIKDLAGVKLYLKTWGQATFELVPSEAYAQATTYPLTANSLEPPIGTQLSDRTRDRWIRCNNGRWTCDDNATVTDEGAASWTTVTEYAPLYPWTA